MKQIVSCSPSWVTDVATAFLHQTKTLFCIIFTDCLNDKEQIKCIKWEQGVCKSLKGCKMSCVSVQALHCNKQPNQIFVKSRIFGWKLTFLMLQIFTPATEPDTVFYHVGKLLINLNSL